MKNEQHFFHCASKGLEDGLLFNSKEQFIVGMNRVAFCLQNNPDIIIIAFVLMDNHVHFILYGTRDDCYRFMADYKKLTSYYLSRKCDMKLDIFEYDCWMIPNREKLIEKICYVLRNPLAAGMNIMPTSYQWGSGPLMFSGNRNEPPVGFHSIGETTEYYRRHVFGTKHEIPPKWLVNDDGLIWSGSYVDYSRAETLLGSITNFMFELSRKNEDQINQEMYGSTISLNDNDVMQILKKEALENFGEANISYLIVSQRLDLIRLMRRKYGSDIKQMGRLLHLKQQELKSIW